MAAIYRRRLICALSLIYIVINEWGFAICGCLRNRSLLKFWRPSYLLRQNCRSVFDIIGDSLGACQVDHVISGLELCWFGLLLLLRLHYNAAAAWSWSRKAIRCWNYFHLRTTVALVSNEMTHPHRISKTINAHISSKFSANMLQEVCHARKCALRLHS